MFFGNQILGKKEPLGVAWQSGCGNKVTKRMVMRENILRTCDAIMQPVIPLALRLSAILMSGVVTIFHKKQVRVPLPIPRPLPSISLLICLPDSLCLSRRHTSLRRPTAP